MDKKLVVLLCIIILLAASVGLIMDLNIFSNQENEVKVGNAIFQVPEGYQIGEFGEDNVTNLTNGTHEIYIEEYDSKNVEKRVNEYVDKIHYNNKGVTISNFTVGTTLVYRSNLDTSGNVHYWFVKDNNTYTIYSWDKNPKIDSITIKLIESIS